MLGQNSSDMRMVMLYRQHRYATLTRHLFDLRCGVIIAIEVMRNQGWRDFQHAKQMVDGLPERHQSSRIRQFADMLRDKRLVAAGHAHRISDGSAHRQNGRPGVRQFDRFGHMTA